MKPVLASYRIEAEFRVLHFPPGRESVTECHLRQVLKSPVWAEQRAVWRRLPTCP